MTAFLGWSFYSMAFSDFIVFADESGSPVLEGPDPTFPVFVLSCVLISKQVYAEQVVPQLQRLKFDFVGHDQIVLHERDIRRQQKAFAFLQASSAVREAFLNRINDIVAGADIDVITAVIDKVRLAERYAKPWNPYEIALNFCMEKLLARLRALEQQDRLIHVVFEGRGKKEDAELELHFRRIAANQANWGYKNPDFSFLNWEPVFVDKKCNSSGLQLADLMARPIGLKALRPLQANRAFDLLQPKLKADGLKVFP
ncbi:DUF3800 domain-containing protein [uncultured Brevundimonas sp.]|uniref:DUF3800 domain-containing protein n=1 Tax=uncultured Brevundimonas sp. TaxID=213418 RepID=UPI0025D430EB|nr:DUF3800 domain-containing protein [uncultured Brevundimonas sp.]